MAYFGTARDKKSDNYDVGEKAKSHPVRLAGAFRRVNGKLGLRRIADHRPGILPNLKLWRSAFVEQLHSNVYI
jgi:hypothetical protein